MRNPINHPAVMYKKSIVEQAGGYKKMMWFYNIQEPLVNMRAA